MRLRPDGLITLNSGSYVTRGPIGLNERCINLYQEVNPSEADPDAAVSHYTRPGLIPLATAPVSGLGRGVFTMSNGNLYAVIGQYLYAVSSSFALTQVGQIGPFSTPVSMDDNGVTAVLVDGTTTGYTIDLGSNGFGYLIDPTGFFQGSNKVDYADTFLAFASPGTRDWFTSLSNSVTFDPLVSAAKTSYPDPIQSFAFNLRQMVLIGTQTTEVWYLSGGSSTTSFAYAEWPNVFIPYGTVAPYSLAKADVNLFWLSQNAQGDLIVLQLIGYAVSAVSTRALETEFSTYPNPADAIAYTYQQAGHTFYCITFQQANKSWCYDMSTKQWHQRGWTDANGVLNRERVAFVTPAYGKIVGQDWQTGELYALDLQTYTDKGNPIVCRRAFPHATANLKEVTHSSFIADLAYFGLPESGGRDYNAAGATPNNPIPPGGGEDDFNLDFGPLPTPSQNVIFLRYSNNGGVAWSNYRGKGLSVIQGTNYRSLLRWRGLGMARDRVFELSWSVPALVTLQGAYIEPIVHGA